MIYVDPLALYGNRQWCHMATDGSLDELHQFAASIGLRREWFQNHERVPHYDLTPGKRHQAVRAGAVQVTGVELFLKCKKGGK